MDVRVEEIAERIFRFSTFVPVITPAGFTINQFLIAGQEPLLFHCGPRGFFPAIASAFSRVMPVERLRWISFGHVESDECGAMNNWLAAAPKAQVIHGETACMVSLNDLADRPPRVLKDRERLDLGGRTICYIDTPHVPHAWESGIIFEETTATLFCGDLFTQVGNGPALTKENIVPAAIAAEDAFHSTSLTPVTAPTIRALKQFAPKRLATMHGSSYLGDGATALEELAAYYESAVSKAAAESARKI